MYRRLLRYLRPHAWRMIGTVTSNVIAAALDVFSFTLLLIINGLQAWTAKRTGRDR